MSDLVGNQNVGFLMTRLKCAWVGVYVVVCIALVVVLGVHSRRLIMLLGLEGADFPVINYLCLCFVFEVFPPPLGACNRHCYI